MTINHSMQKTPGIRSMIIFSVVSLLISLPCTDLPAFPGTAWVSGRVLSTSINGQGYPGKTAGPNFRRNLIWWSYCIASDARSYLVYSNENPEKTGLKEGSTIEFWEKQNQIYVLNPAGKRIALKVVRKGKAGQCP